MQRERQRIRCAVRVGIVELRERLHRLDFIVVNNGEFAERSVAIGFGRIRPVSTGWKASFVGPGDDGVQIGMHDRVDVEYLDDRLAGLGMACRIYRVVIDHRLAAGSFLRRTIRVLESRQCHVRLR